MAGSLPLLPHLLIVKGETRKTSATSLTVNKSGKFSSDNLVFIREDEVFILNLHQPFCLNVYHRVSEHVNPSISFGIDPDPSIDSGSH